MLLYIHVPFCRSKCAYCAFYSEPLIGNHDLLQAIEEAPFIPTPQPAAGAIPVVPSMPDVGQNRMQLWLDSLLMEMALWSDRLKRPEVSTVFFGGGTPSLVPPSMIKVILDRISRSFRLDPKAEISMEANPESITAASAREYVRAGINRVSLGVQAMDDDSLEMMGRVHNTVDVYKAFNALKAAHCRNIGVDLIWGLPGQSVFSWLNQLAEVIRLKPDHLSCYGLTLEPGTSMDFLVEKGVYTLPQERELANMYVRGAEILEEAGYLHYEVSNFARMGYQCRHNVGYWEGEDYLGLGPSATSTISGRRWTNPSDLYGWAEIVDDRKVGREFESLSRTDRVLELLMLRLRTTRGLRFKAYRALTGHDFLKDHKALVHALHRHGLIRIRNGYIWLTRNGMLVSNSILERFFDSAREHLTGEEPGGIEIVADAALASPEEETPSARTDVEEPEDELAALATRARRESRDGARSIGVWTS